MSFTESLENIIKENENKLLGSHPSWERIPLSYIASILNGFAFPSSQFSKDRGKPLLRIRDILKNKTEAYFEGEYDPHYIVNKGDLIIGMDGDFQCALWNGSEALLNQRVCKINLVEEYYNKKFLSLLLPGYLSAINAATSSVTVKHLSSRTISEILIPLPPLPEQHRIVSCIEELFSRLDAGVEALRRARAQLQRYRQSVLQSAVTGRLTADWRAAHPEVEPAEEMLDKICKEHRRPPERIESSDLPNLPEGWIWASTDQLASNDKYSMAIGPFGSDLKVVDYRSEGVPLIFVRNIRSGIFNGQGTWFVSNEKAEELKAHFVESGDILITKMGDPPGDACIYPENMPPAIITADCIKWRLSPLLKEKMYFSNAINSILVKKQILRSTKGVAQQKISLIRFKKIGIPLPPPQEQNEIAKRIESCFSSADQTEREFNRSILLSSSLRQSILQRAFLGQLVSQDPNDEPASLLLERIRAERIKPSPRGRKSNDHQSRLSP